MPTTFAQIVDEVHELDSESKRELVTLLKTWLIEERREEIARNAEQSEREYRAGQTQSGDTNDLMADLYAED